MAEVAEKSVLLTNTLKTLQGPLTGSNHGFMDTGYSLSPLPSYFPLHCAPVLLCSSSLGMHDYVWKIGLWETVVIRKEVLCDLSADTSVATSERKCGK